MLPSPSQSAVAAATAGSGVSGRASGARAAPRRGRDPRPRSPSARSRPWDARRRSSPPPGPGIRAPRRPRSASRSRRRSGPPRARDAATRPERGPAALRRARTARPGSRPRRRPPGPSCPRRPPRRRAPPGPRPRAAPPRPPRARAARARTPRAIEPPMRPGLTTVRRGQRGALTAGGSLPEHRPQPLQQPRVLLGRPEERSTAPPERSGSDLLDGLAGLIGMDVQDRFVGQALPGDAHGARLTPAPGTTRGP